MAGPRTRPTGASVAAYIASRANAQQRRDCKALMAMFRRLTGRRPYMWGPSIVGYGTHRYTYASGHSGEAPAAAFAIRGRDLVVYLDCEDGGQRALLAKLGRHRMGRSCLYFRALEDLDASVLERLVAGSLAAAPRLHAR